MLSILADEALADFRNIAKIADPTCDPDNITVEVLSKPHTAGKLPDGTAAVYCFFLNGRAIKIGMVRSNSNPRFQSQHYSVNGAGSTLARSIVSNPDKVGGPRVDESNIGAWIRENTDRINFLVPSQYGDRIVRLLESTLHSRWRPIFESYD